MILFHSLVYSQQTEKSYSVKKSTITFVGSSNYLFENNNFKVVHSIGQSSIIGLQKVTNYTIQQGFINNHLFFNIKNNDTFIREEINFTISPNPFVDYILINFSKKPEFDIHIRLFDVTGKIHLNKKYTAKESLQIPLKNLSIGSYLITVQSGRDVKSKKLIKIE